MRLVPLLVALSLGTACSSSRQSAAPASSTPSAASQEPAPVEPRAPLSLEISGPAAVTAPSDIVLTVKTHAPAAVGIPLRWHVTLPAGVQLVDGKADDTVTLEKAVDERVIRVHLDGVPAEDLHVDMVADAGNWGAHARATYRFGRPAPVTPQPTREGPAVNVQGRDLGQPIPLDGK